MGLNISSNKSYKYRVINFLFSTSKEFDTFDDAQKYYKNIKYKRDFVLQRLTDVSWKKC